MKTMNKITMNRNISSILAGILLISVSCSTRQKDPSAKDAEVLPDNIVELGAEQFKVAGVEYGAIEPKNLSSTLKANGLITVSPKDLASVCAPLGGFVKSTDFVQGSPVRKGQALAVMKILLSSNFSKIISKAAAAWNMLKVSSTGTRNSSRMTSIQPKISRKSPPIIKV